MLGPTRGVRKYGLRGDFVCTAYGASTDVRMDDKSLQGPYPQVQKEHQEVIHRASLCVVQDPLMVDEPCPQVLRLDNQTR